MLALGSLADDAWQKWKQTPVGQTYSPGYQHVTHPTEPESSSGGDPAKLAAAIAAMLEQLEPGARRAPPADHSIPTCRARSSRTAKPFKPEELVEIPEFDVPAGLPEWMRSPAAWAQRVGDHGGRQARRTSRSRFPPE